MTMIVSVKFNGPVVAKVKSTSAERWLENVPKW